MVQFKYKKLSSQLPEFFYNILSLFPFLIYILLLYESKMENASLIFITVIVSFVVYYSLSHIKYSMFKFHYLTLIIFGILSVAGIAYIFQTSFGYKKTVDLFFGFVYLIIVCLPIIIIISLFNIYLVVSYILRNFGKHTISWKERRTCYLNLLINILLVFNLTFPHLIQMILDS